MFRIGKKLTLEPLFSCRLGEVSLFLKLLLSLVMLGLALGFQSTVGVGLSVTASEICILSMVVVIVTSGRSVSLLVVA